MKKFISILLVAMLVITLSACGKEQNEPEEVKTTVPVSEEAAEENNDSNAYSFFNEDNYTDERGEPTTYPDNKYQIRTTYTIKEKTERTLPVEITLDSTEITFDSTKILNLTGSGWTLADGAKADTSVKAHQYTNTFAKSPDGKKATIYGCNKTDAPINFIDCVVWDVILDYTGEKTDVTDFNYADGITSESSIDDVVRKFGEPDTIFIDEHYVDNEVEYSEITVVYTVKKSIEVRFEFRNEGTKSTMIRAEFRHQQ